MRFFLGTHAQAVRICDMVVRKRAFTKLTIQRWSKQQTSFQPVFGTTVCFQSSLSDAHTNMVEHKD